MKRRSLLVALVVSLLPACGPEPPAPEAELGEVCGSASPFRVLELEQDEVINYGTPQRIADRIYYTVYKRGETDPGSAFPELIDPTIWATGPCGESPVRVANGVVSISTFEIWPSVPLGCEKATDQIVALDPAGVETPHVIFPHAPPEGTCGLNRTAYGLISIESHDEEFGTLLLHPYPADPHTETSTPVVLLDSIRLRATREGGSRNDVLAIFDDFVLAVTPDDALVRIDLVDGAVSLLQEHVSMFDASWSSGRYVLWQDATATAGDDPRVPEGKIFLRDQADGSDVLLHETSLAYSIFPMSLAELGIVQLGLGYFNRDPKRVFFLPELDFVDVPAELFLNAQIDEDRWIGGPLGGSSYNLINLRTGESRPLFSRGAEHVYLDADALEVAELPGCCDEETYRAEGPLWRLPLDGSEPQLLANRVTHKVRHLDDGRFVSPLDLDEQWIGTLALIDPDTQSEMRIDQQVFSFSMHTFRVEDEGLLTYSVSDGERSGVYLAKLPPNVQAPTRAHVLRSGLNWLSPDMARNATRPVSDAR